MVQKLLLTALVLLWITPQFMAKHSLKAKFTTMQKINCREEDEIINKPLSCTALECNIYQTDKDVVIELSRPTRDTSIQYIYRQHKKDQIKGFIPKPVARPEYGMGYQHQGMLLQNLHEWYLYIDIRLPKLEDLIQRERQIFLIVTIMV